RVECWVRVKPTNNFAQGLIDVQDDLKTINIQAAKEADTSETNNQKTSWSFKTDGVLANVNQQLVFETVAKQVLDSLLQGCNGSIFCYGQTGAGKTFTMTGLSEIFDNRGLVPRSISYIFNHVQSDCQRSFNISISYIEIYNEVMYDLLPHSFKNDSRTNKKQFEPLAIKELDDNNFVVKGMNCYPVTCENEALNLLFEGEMNRTISSHKMNRQSSRSHCIFTIYLQSHSLVHSDNRYMMSRLNFVDLAGSERIKKTQSKGKTLEEAGYINKSLLYLEQVITALTESNRGHVPYRQSKLTFFLKDSIGGCCLTRLIANVWGEAKHLFETVSTLRFAMSMMKVREQPTINTYVDPCMQVTLLEQEVTRLKRELALHDALNSSNNNNNKRTTNNYDGLCEKERVNIRQCVKAYVEDHCDDIEIVSATQVKEVFSAFKSIYQESLKATNDAYHSNYILLNAHDPNIVSMLQAVGLLGANAAAATSVTVAAATAATAAKTVAAVVGDKKDDDKNVKQSCKLCGF
ncbi:hypothetical protein HELRODRAFT_92006, partial [Helobdella robusta]|uniref:Kinesin-like protein n=1 Tax=Helobdella robusta TaxID=6412 RepID=T1G8B3_HELRO